MKFLRATVKVFFFIFLLFDCAVFTLIYMVSGQVSDTYKINKGETLQLDTMVPVKAIFSNTSAVDSKTYKVGETFKVDLKIFGVIPFSSADVEVVDDMYAAVLGTPFGMKIYTEGVLVIDLTDINTESGALNPAKEAGIKVGDYIESVNGEKVTCNEDLSYLVESSGGKPLKFRISRKGRIVNINVKPQKSIDDGLWRLGVWVRDSSAGIGTLTFYSPSTNIVCGLGHGICDDDTDTLLTVERGEMVNAQIVSVTKGSAGSPGELKGKFTFDTIADIDLNSDCGIYGQLKGKINVANLTEIALKQEVEDGEAQILCTTMGDTAKLYSCTIKKRMVNYHANTQNFIITVTDPELIAQTGGIVQGMSGSPILQNGKLIGAITHVLIDDSTKGYGIFAENMLETANRVGTGVPDCPQDEQLKEAS